jgi:hypothetical protein
MFVYLYTHITHLSITLYILLVNNSKTGLLSAKTFLRDFSKASSQSRDANGLARVLRGLRGLLVGLVALRGLLVG